jgi:hypothetical protein
VRPAWVAMGRKGSGGWRVILGLQDSLDGVEDASAGVWKAGEDQGVPALRAWRNCAPPPGPETSRRHTPSLRTTPLDRGDLTGRAGMAPQFCGAGGGRFFRDFWVGAFLTFSAS